MVVFVGKDLNINIEVNTEDNITIQWQILEPEINSSWVDLEDSDLYRGKTKSLNDH